MCWHQAMNTDNKVKDVLGTYLVQENGAQLETEPVREWVERGGWSNRKPHEVPEMPGG